MEGVIRKATVEDLDQIFEIEMLAYEFPWTRGIFSDCLRVGYLGIVFALEQKVLGYAFLSVAAGEGHVLNICVHPDWKERGIGGGLLSALIQTAERMKVSALFLEVRVSNLAALAMYHKYGFNEIGLRKNYYPAKKGREDAIVLAKQFAGLD